ncbi:hypothetical protein FDB41_10575 [Clostridium botulinum]|nr:hypothetical protein [Clostridium botulinum]NFO53990.1 hypothetical protein [Clostridium botulinum]
MELLKKCIKEHEENIELSYLWVEDYKIINNQGFNFGSKYIFKYDYNKDKISKEENKNYIKNFWGKNITNITSIVGQNGSGKSFILSNITKILFNENIKHISIFIKDKDIIIIKNNEICKLDIDSDLNDVNIKWFPLDDYRIRKLLQIKTLYSIFYSNVFCNSFESMGASTILIRNSISTGNLLWGFEYSKQDFPIRKLKQFDILLMIQYLAADRKKVNEIIYPEVKYLKIEIIDNYANELKDSEKRKGIYSNKRPFFDSNLLSDYMIEKSKNYIKVRDEIFSYISEITTEKMSEKFQIMSIKNIMYDFYKEIEFKSDIQISISNLPEYKFNNNENFDLTKLKKQIINIFKSIISYIESNKTDEENYFDNIKLKIKISNYIKFIEVLDSITKKMIFDKELIIIKLEDNLENLGNYIKQYYDTCQNDYYIFEWIQGIDNDRRILSSGEESIFKMYARLYNQITHKYSVTGFDVSEKLNKNILVLMDEPEVYLHPEWQRNLITNLVNFFNKYFSEHNVQLIITSNTPFLISDMPRKNIILLEKDKKTGNVKVRDELLQRSFGQNIHTLLKESFFMKSTIGEYSRNKINEIIIALKPIEKNNKDEKLIYPTVNQIMKKLNVENIEDVENMIELIGEPVLMIKLNEMLNRCIRNSDRILYKEKIKQKIRLLKDELDSIDKE